MDATNIRIIRVGVPGDQTPNQTPNSKDPSKDKERQMSMSASGRPTGARYKEKFVGMREKYETVVSTNTQFERDLANAENRIKLLQEEIDLLLDVIVDENVALPHSNGLGPSGSAHFHSSRPGTGASHLGQQLPPQHASGHVHTSPQNYSHNQHRPEYDAPRHLPLHSSHRGYSPPLSPADHARLPLPVQQQSRRYERERDRDSDREREPGRERDRERERELERDIGRERERELADLPLPLLAPPMSPSPVDSPPHRPNALPHSPDVYGSSSRSHIHANGNDRPVDVAMTNGTLETDAKTNGAAPHPTTNGNGAPATVELGQEGRPWVEPETSIQIIQHDTNGRLS